MTGQAWISRPYSDVRFAGGQHYHRPAWGIWHLWLWRDAVHAAQAAALTGVAAALSGALPAIRILQRLDHRGKR